MSRSEWHGVACPLCTVNTGPLFAWEVASISKKRRVAEGGFAEWDRRVHDHMGAAEIREAENGEGRLSEQHADVMWVIVPDEVLFFG